MQITILDNTSPVNLQLRDLKEGDAATYDLTLSAEGLEEFIKCSGDRAPNHTDVGHAQAMGFRDRIVHGFYTGLPFSRMLGMYLPGPNCVIQCVDLKFQREVYVGDSLSYRVSIERLIPSVGTVKLGLSAKRKNGETVCSGMCQCVFRVRC